MLLCLSPSLSHYLQTKLKYRESTQLNQSGNPVESQIGVAAEQPMHPVDIYRQLEAERLNIRSVIPPQFDHRYSENTRYRTGGSGVHPAQTSPQSIPGPSQSHQTQIQSSDLNYFAPEQPVHPADAYRQFSHAVIPPQLDPDYSEIQDQSDFPDNFNYAPSSIMVMRPSLFILETNPFSLCVRTVRVLSCTFPYEVPSQHVVAERPSRPGEMELGQAFVVQRPVI